MKYYYFMQGDSQQGPYSLEQIKGFNLTKNTLIWSEGMENWKKAVEIPEIASIIIETSKKSSGIGTFKTIVIVVLLLIISVIAFLFFSFMNYLKDRESLADTQKESNYTKDIKNEDPLKEQPKKEEVPKEDVSKIEKELPHVQVPEGTVQSFISENFYKNGHNEYLFSDTNGNFTYWSTNQHEYIKLITEEEFENVKTIRFPNSEKLYKLYLQINTIIVEDEKGEIQKYRQFN